MSNVITVTTGARLHFGPLACGSGRGRRFGGIGMMIAFPRCRVRVRRSAENQIAGPADLEFRIEQVRAACQAALPQLGPVRIEILEEIPAHRGFGAGTQVSLAIARALSELAGERNLGSAAMATRSGRGDRSAIGLHGFDRGGFLVDAGKHLAERLGALACRQPVPEAWRIVLSCRESTVGLSGESERAAFARLAPMSIETSDRLSRIVLTEILPALQQVDCLAFQTALAEYGNLVGQYFSPIQEGPFSDLHLWKVSEARRREGIGGLVQTSWGPTAAICCGSESEAAATETSLRQALGPGYRTWIVRPANDGAEIQASHA